MSGARDLDKMLAEWPTATPTDSEREDFAARVVDTINAESMGKMEASTEALLAPPLPARESEGKLAASARPGDARASFPSVTGLENKMSKDRAKDRTSFQELAKLAGTPAPPAATPSATPPPAAVVRAEEGGSDDSGIVDLKMVAQLDPSGGERAKSTPLAASGLFDEDAPASAAAAAASAPPPSVSATAQSAPPPPVAASASVPPSATPSVAPASAAAAPSVAPAPKKDEKKKGGGAVIFLGGLLAVGAIAAGAFFVVKSGVLSGSKETAQTTQSQPAATVAQTKPTATAAASVAAVDTAQQGQGGVDMDSLPSTVDTTGKRVMPKINAANGTKPNGTVAAVDSAAAAPTGSVDPRLVANNIPNGGSGGGGDLTEAMRAAAGGGAAATATATSTGPAYAPGSVPQKPSQGQVQGAINAVLPEARKCMAEGDPISRANIVFQSDGSVQSVSVSGFAAGKPNEACVKAAFQKAKISPFAEASYSFPVTVRPM